MPTRNITEYLGSGEVPDIKKGGTDPDDSLQDLGEVKVITDALDTRVASLEEGHTVVLNAVCPAASQEPIALDTPLQIVFGPAQGLPTDPVSLEADGTLTFNVTDKYIINFRAHYGRTGASGTSVLMFRFVKNGVTQVGDPYAAKIADADTLIPWDSSSFIFEAVAGDTLHAEIVRDSAGSNFGGLFAVPATVVGWGSAPCAAVSCYKV